MGMAEGLTIFLKKLKNMTPGMVWPLQAIIYDVYDEDKVRFVATDSMRSGTNAKGDFIYIFKDTGGEFIPPRRGLEDPTGTITLLQTGDNSYKVVKKVELDSESKKIMLTLHDDEQMKFLYARQILDKAERTQPDLPWWKSSIVFLICCLIALSITGIIMTGQAQGISDQIDRLASVLSRQVDALSAIAIKPPI